MQNNKNFVRVTRGHAPTPNKPSFFYRAVTMQKRIIENFFSRKKIKEQEVSQHNNGLLWSWGLVPTSFPALSRQSRDARSAMRGKVWGFTVIELVVTISIFIIVTGVILANYNTFSSRTVLDNLAHEIALTIRQAQVFGISVQEFGIGSDIFPSYGVMFTKQDNTSFLIFADKNGNGKYDSINNELLENFSLRGGNIISKMCGHVSATGPCVELNSLDVTFTRPDPEATIKGSPDLGAYTYTKITVLNLGGDSRNIVIWANGQISIQ